MRGHIPFPFPFPTHVRIYCFDTRMRELMNLFVVCFGHLIVKDKNERQ